MGCDPDAAAPSGYICPQLSSGGGALLATCDATNRCRDGYICIIDTTTNIGTCDVQCSRDAQCSVVGHCDLYSGLCQAEQTGAGLIGACTRDEQCKSGNCVTGMGATPNFCATRCNLLDAACPEHGVCVSISSDPGYTAGFCFLPCSQGTCAAGFSCDTQRGACIPTF